MKETTKTHPLRIAGDHYKKFLNGKGIDIGPGDDLLRIPDGTVAPYDKAQGDAQLMEGVEDETFNFVHSSHCLEHMRDVPEALKNWARIVKPGGYLYVVVPDYIRYEHLRFPSRFNRDHKQTFSLELRREHVKRLNHWHGDDLDELAISLGLNLLEGDSRIQDAGFDYNLGDVDQTMMGALAQILFVFEKSKK